MSLEKSPRRAVVSWIYVCPLLILCGILGFLQYRLIGEVRDAARDRMRGSLQASLTRVSQELDTEIATAIAAIAPLKPQNDATTAEELLRQSYDQWKQNTRHGQMFSRVALAVPQGVELRLINIEPSNLAVDGVWPGSLLPLRGRLEARLSARPWPGRGGGPLPPSQDMNAHHDDEGYAMEIPIFPAPHPPSPGFSLGPFGRRELAWVIFEL